MENEKLVLKISSKSIPADVAGAIAGLIKEEGKAVLKAIGAGAVNQTVKAIATARGYVAPEGYDLICVPAFTTANVGDNEERTCMKFIVTYR